MGYVKLKDGSVLKFKRASQFQFNGEWLRVGLKDQPATLIAAIRTSDVASYGFDLPVVRKSTRRRRK